MTPTSGTGQRGEQAADKTAIRPFQVNVPEAELVDLRKRINATRWPERETVADTSQGVQLATIQKLAAAPRSWVEKAYPKLIHFNRLPKGGHFAAWEQPQLFVEEVRVGFRPLRK